MLRQDKNIINRKKILLDKGHTLATLAAKTPYSVPSVFRAIKTPQRNSRDVHESIVSVLEVSLAEFYPELYGPDVVNKIFSQNIAPSNFEKILTETQQSNQGI